MKEFSSSIARTWKIREKVARELCDAFDNGDSPYYLADYCPDIAAEADSVQLWAIYDFLKEAEHSGWLGKYVVADRLEQVTTCHSLSMLIEKGVTL